MPTNVNLFLSALAVALMGTIDANAQVSPCTPQWTVSFSVEFGADTSQMTLEMDTSATFGFDQGLDTLCLSDSGGVHACLLVCLPFFPGIQSFSYGPPPMFLMKQGHACLCEQLQAPGSPVRPWP